MQKEDAHAFSCCFINTKGQMKIDVDTVDTFKVIYSDGLVTDDWVFDSESITKTKDKIKV